MALKKAINTGGDYLDLKELARGTTGILCVFRIREFQTAEPGKFGPRLPVVADVLIASGPRAGEVCANERFFGAITTALRGVRNPKQGEPIPTPTNAVGDDVAVRVKVANEGQGNETAVGDEPTDAECDAIELYYRDGAGFTVQAAEAPAMAGAGAPAGGAPSSRPWDN